MSPAVGVGNLPHIHRDRTRNGAQYGSDTPYPYISRIHCQYYLQVRWVKPPHPPVPDRLLCILVNKEEAGTNRAQSIKSCWKKSVAKCFSTLYRAHCSAHGTQHPFLCSRVIRLWRARGGGGAKQKKLGGYCTPSGVSNPRTHTRTILILCCVQDMYRQLE